MHPILTFGRLWRRRLGRRWRAARLRVAGHRIRPLSLTQHLLITAPVPLGQRVRLPPIRRLVAPGVLALFRSRLEGQGARSRLTVQSTIVSLWPRAMQDINFLRVSRAQLDDATWECAQRKAGEILTGLPAQPAKGGQWLGTRLQARATPAPDEGTATTSRPPGDIFECAQRDRSLSLRRLLWVGMRCRDPDAYRRALPAPLQAVGQNELYFFCALNGGSTERLEPSGAESFLYVEAGFNCGLLTEQGLERVVCPVWNHREPLSVGAIAGEWWHWVSAVVRTRRVWPTVRARYGAGPEGTAVRVAVGKSIDWVHREVPVRILEQGDQPPRELFQAWNTIARDRDGIGMRVARAKPVVALNRLYVCSPSPAGNGVREFLSTLINCDVEQWGPALFCPRLDLDFRPVLVPFGDILYDGSRTARHESLLQPEESRPAMAPANP